jgi:dipeptidyl aminopeptidase/acylaminoacyl peptidase
VRPARSIVAVLLVVCASARLARADALTLKHPDDSSKEIEYFVGRPEGKGPWPTIVFIHGHQEGEAPGGQMFEPVLGKYAARGILAVAVSQPGYGHSSGPRDFCGPFSQHAVAGVLAKLRDDGLVGKLVVEGVSRGASVAGLVAAHDPSIAGLIMISGEYDFSTLAADSTATGIMQAVRDNLLRESGGTPQALHDRSVIDFAKDIKAATLILSGGRDDRTRPEHARELADAINHAGGTARAVVFPDAGHMIPMDVRNREIQPFLDRIFGLTEGHE